MWVSSQDSLCTSIQLSPVSKLYIPSTIRMRNKSLCTIVTHSYRISYHLTQGFQIKIYPKFSGLCTTTDRSHLAVFCIDRNTIGCYDFVRMKFNKTFTVCCWEEASKSQFAWWWAFLHSIACWVRARARPRVRARQKMHPFSQSLSLLTFN